MGVPRHFKEHVFVTAIALEKSAASRNGFGEEQPCSVAADMPLNARHVGMLALPTVDQGDQFLRRRDGDGQDGRAGFGERQPLARGQAGVTRFVNTRELRSRRAADAASSQQTEEESVEHPW